MTAGEDLVGMVGYGAMGVVFVERLVAAGRTPVVFDVAEPARRSAADAGLRVAGSVAELAASCDVIGVVVRDDDEVLQVMTGPTGVISGARAGTVVMIHSTITPETVHRVGAAAIDAGVDLVDAPAVGVPAAVRAGTAAFLVGGSESTVQRVTPYLDQIAKQVIHLGPLGAGTVAKLVKNLVTGSERLVIHEALQIGEASGLHFTDVLEMLRTLRRDQVPVVERWEQVFDPTAPGPRPVTGGNLHLFDKDIPLAARLAEELGLELPITEQLAAAGLRLSGEDSSCCDSSCP